MAQQATARPSPAEPSIEQAVTLHRAGRLGEAERAYGAILAVEPDHFDALHLSGVLKHQQGQSVDGLRRVAAALKAKPGATDALMNYGVILEELKRHEEALAIFDQALAMGAGDAALHYNRGNALKGLGRYTEALASYDRALAHAPALIEAHHNRASTLTELDRYEDALASYDRALALPRTDIDAAARAGNEPENGAALPSAAEANSIAALNNRGTVLTKLKRYDEALASYDQALALRPDYADALSNRGLVLAELGRYDEALEYYARALALAPDFVNAHLNRGNAFIALARMEDALRSYAAALAVEPDNPDVNFNDGLTRLTLGDLRDGWRKYEYRWQRKKNPVSRPSYPRPMWRGDSDLHGKVVLLCAEQGMGDVIQFVRYAPLVAALGAKVLVGVHRPLTALIACVAGVSEVIADGEALPHFDLYCPLLSLPLAFKTELPTIPAQVPYVRAFDDRIDKWRARVPQNGRLRVGICWAGTSGHLNDHRRSIPLERFATLLSVRGADFVSVQKEVNEHQAAILSRHGVTQLGQDFADFADTAAVLAMLDLVISVDTSVAHLAGAMAKAVGLLVPFSPDFRWLMDRTDSPWYPTMRLFRQPAIGDWDAPLERLRCELSDLVGS